MEKGEIRGQINKGAGASGIGKEEAVEKRKTIHLLNKLINFD